MKITFLFRTMLALWFVNILCDTFKHKDFNADGLRPKSSHQKLTRCPFPVAQGDDISVDH